MTDLPNVDSEQAKPSRASRRQTFANGAEEMEESGHKVKGRRRTVAASGYVGKVETKGSEGQGEAADSSASNKEQVKSAKKSDTSLSASKTVEEDLANSKGDKINVSKDRESRKSHMASERTAIEDIKSPQCVGRASRGKGRTTVVEDKDEKLEITDDLVSPKGDNISRSRESTRLRTLSKSESNNVKSPETARLDQMKSTSADKRAVTNFKAKDRYMVEREEIEEEMKLQQLAKSASPAGAPGGRAWTSPRKRRHEGDGEVQASRTSPRGKRTGRDGDVWKNIDEYIITPVKRLFRSSHQ